ncbi:hypothetical protein ABIE27_006206, partial [Paenibacillus sp. 4624]|uniref:hypothetical protein n=1 Tax=Paenibacillus sp. 4624 TaxID=3156453 RepID=UPI003D24E6E4
QPNPTQPNPTQPNPTQPNPTQPNPTQPNPTQLSGGASMCKLLKNHTTNTPTFLTITDELICTILSSLKF